MAKHDKPRLLVAIITCAMMAGLTFGNPLALAEPGVAPPPVPNDPAAAPFPPDPPAPSPPLDPLAPSPPASPFELPNSFEPPPADSLAAQPSVIPEGTPAGQNPTPYTGQPVFGGCPGLRGI